MAENDMAEILGKISSIANSSNIPDDIKNMVNNLPKDDTSSSNFNISPEMINTISSMFNNTSSSTETGTSTDTSTSDSNSSFNFDINTMLKMKQIMEKMNGNKNDPRSTLLLSLKPYLNEKRKTKVEDYVKFLNIANVFSMLNITGGDKNK